MSKKLWGGRFKKKTNPIFEKFSSSIGVDYRLVKCDLVGSLLHIYVLNTSHLISPQEFSALKKGLLFLLAQADKKSFPYDFASEDIHTNIQNLLEKKVGRTALKLQTCRSRNDQVVFATKLYCFIFGTKLGEGLLHLEKTLLDVGSTHASLVMPGYTHLQHAQPVYFKDYCRAYASMFKKDIQRLQDSLARLDISQGAGALAGTPIAASVYQKAIQKALKDLKLDGLKNLIGACENSLAVVSDRDFVIELLSVMAVVGMHISRLCEDFILWSSQEFGFIEIGDEYCTGSSLMPQKKNPDALELMR